MFAVEPELLREQRPVKRGERTARLHNSDCVVGVRLAVLEESAGTTL